MHRKSRKMALLLSVFMLLSLPIAVQAETTEGDLYESWKTQVPVLQWTQGDYYLCLGDVNADREISAADALEMLQYSVKVRQEFSGKPLFWEVADTNGNGAVSADDALEVLQYAVNKREAFTVQTLYSYPNGKAIQNEVIAATKAGFADNLQTIDTVMEKEALTEQDAIDLAVACCSLQLAGVPYATPSFNQSPAWHARQVKELARSTPERATAINEFPPVFGTPIFDGLLEHGVFSLPYVIENDEIMYTYIRYIYLTLNRSENHNITWFMSQHVDLSEEKWAGRTVYNRISHTVMSSYPPPFDRDSAEAWEQFFTEYEEDFAALKAWCEQ